MPDRDARPVQISKLLSKLLRHRATSANIPLDREGFAPLDAVLQWPPLKNLNVSVAEVECVVRDDAKQRFSIKCDGGTCLVRANQGHSVQVDETAMFEKLGEEDFSDGRGAVHGTYFAFWGEIVRTGGLKPMGRGHVHCAVAEGAVSGMRADAELVVEVDVRASMVEGGLNWWRSANGVVLTDGGPEGVVSTSFFRRVSGRKAGVGVLWEHGERVADLPPGLRMVVPPGKKKRGGKRT